jgi:general secretion pathway protein I
LSPTVKPDHGIAGFTLIEALIALAIVAVSLASIGALVATGVRGTHSIDARLNELETARSIATALPGREQLVPGSLSGEIAGHHWRIDVSPYVPAGVQIQPTTPWMPEAVTVTVQSPSGEVLQFNTVRLHRRAGG